METDENVAVANTFTQEWEWEKYDFLAAKLGYMVFFIIVENRHGNKSIHDTPDAAVNRMKDRFEVKL